MCTIIFKKNLKQEIPLYGFIYFLHNSYERRQFIRLFQYFNFKLVIFPSIFGSGTGNCLFFGTNDFNRFVLMIEYLIYSKDPKSSLKLD
jgi:hypothetical protein